MFQFEYLNRQKMPSQKRFQDLMGEFSKAIPSSYAYAVEVRNAQYLKEAFFTFLKQNGLIPVLLQGYWMPSVVQVYERWRERIAAHEMVIIRLHGPDRKGIEEQTGKQWDRIVAPKDKELDGIVEMVQDLASRGGNVDVNVNNHYEGSAPLTIERIQRLLNQ